MRRRTIRRVRRIKRTRPKPSPGRTSRRFKITPPPPGYPTIPGKKYLPHRSTYIRVNRTRLIR